MTLDEFTARFGRIPDLPRAPIVATTAEHAQIIRETCRMADREIADMEAALPPVKSWDDVPDGARVFVRWGGGNRGVYVKWRGELYAMRADGASMRITFGRLPDLGRHRMSDRAWTDPEPRPPEHLWIDRQCTVCGHAPCPVHEPYVFDRSRDR